MDVPLKMGANRQQVAGRRGERLAQGQLHEEDGDAHQQQHDAVGDEEGACKV